MAREACPCGRNHGGWRGRLFAMFMGWASRKHDSLLADRKRRLLADLAGVVVEIGPGTGANFAYLRRGICWIGVEPNPHMHERLRRGAARFEIEADIRGDSAERLDLPDGCADVVLSTLVLCSVADLDGSLREIVRVLRPGGRFVFVEHVAAPAGTWLRRAQRFVRPIWSAVSAGCEPDRDIAAALERAGFDRVRVDRFDVAAPVVRPHIAGVAVKRL